MKVLKFTCDSANYYLKHCESGYLMVDICFPNSLKRLLPNIKQFGIDPTENKYLFMTHFHPNYARAAKDMKEYYTKIIFYGKQIPFVSEIAKHFKPQNNFNPKNSFN